MKISFSAVSTWRQCEQLYDYRYIQKLVPKIEGAPPMLGRILHRFIELTWHKIGGDAEQFALTALQAEFEDELAAMAKAAYAAGQEELSQEFVELWPRAERIARRYWMVRGARDQQIYVPLHIEEFITHEFAPGLEMPAVVDLVTKTHDERVQLWEHKSTGNVPPQTRRLKDLQTVIYAALLEEHFGIKVDEVIWNYLRTKEPTEPKVTKDGTRLHRRMDIDTTWETYQRVIKENEFDEADYVDIRERLEGREAEMFFPRHSLPIFQSEGVLFRDVLTTARYMQRAQRHAEQGTFRPVMNIGTQCDWCSFSKMCQARILGHDADDLKSLLFRRKDDGEDSSTKEGGGASPEVAPLLPDPIPDEGVPAP